MAWIAGRFDDEASQIQVRRQISRLDDRLKQQSDAPLKIRENVHKTRLREPPPL
jgi:hypothetical protein